MEPIGSPHHASPTAGKPFRSITAGVLYAEDFDDESSSDAAATPPAPEPELIEPVFTAAELDAARSEGRAAGRTEAERGVAASRLQLLQSIADGISQAHDEAQRLAEQVAEAVARCMLTTLAAALPALCARHGAQELAALVRVVLPALSSEARIAVKVHPHMVPVLRDELTSLDIEFADRIVMQPSEAIMPGDVRVGWFEGSAGRHGQRTRAAVEDALAQLGLTEGVIPQTETIDA